MIETTPFHRYTSAVLSQDRRHRYKLARRWASGPTAGFIMLNPSTADESKDDPTIRRCISFAKREGCGALIVVNLFSFRATSPKDLWAQRHQDRNDADSARHFHEALEKVDGPLIGAWGAAAITRAPDICREVTTRYWERLQYLGLTIGGQPMHPLYIKGDAPLKHLSQTCARTGELPYD